MAGRTADGYWVGELSSSALSTATALVALGLYVRGAAPPSAHDIALVNGGVAWLLSHQNEDGGWGDTDRSFSNISTTALAWAALAFAEPRRRLRTPWPARKRGWRRVPAASTRRLSRERSWSGTAGTAPSRSRS